MSTATIQIRGKTKVVDLFCGIGGLTHGFIKEGFDVVAGVDSDGTCRYGYERSNHVKFVEKDIMDISATELNALYGEDSAIKILVGCAPCQPFSKLNQKKVGEAEFAPLKKFSGLIREVKPDIVSMENVKDLVKYTVFKSFLGNLTRNGYNYDYKIVDASDYGIPQKRFRLVLLASRLGPIELLPKTHDEDRKVTVRDAISGLKHLRAGQVDENDKLHRARSLDAINKKRIAATPKNGGSSRSWKRDLQLACHMKKTGETYRGTVYARMRWDQPSPTMTTQCIGLGNGRFGHPEQNRAISLREAAILQTFPKSYSFYDPSNDFSASQVAKFIGNAVPVKLARVVAKSISMHIQSYV
jgi:DNA (cytosine-5)-methyltransferase 1